MKTRAMLSRTLVVILLLESLQRYLESLGFFELMVGEPKSMPFIIKRFLLEPSIVAKIK